MDSSARHQRLTDIYLEAFDLQGEERISYLDQACGDDLSLREEVEAMLATHAESDTGLDGLLADEPTILRDLLTDLNRPSCQAISAATGWSRNWAGVDLARCIWPSAIQVDWKNGWP